MGRSSGGGGRGGGGNLASIYGPGAVRGKGVGYNAIREFGQEQMGMIARHFERNPNLPKTPRYIEGTIPVKPISMGKVDRAAVDQFVGGMAGQPRSAIQMAHQRLMSSLRRGQPIDRSVSLATTAELANATWRALGGK